MKTLTVQKSTDGDIRLTSSNIKYLITLLRLGGDSGSVRGTDIAASLGITKPSAHTMLVSLAKMELVRKDHYGGATFTPNGLTLAEKYLSCYEVLDSAFGGLFNDEGQALSPLCALIAELPDESIDSIISDAAKAGCPCPPQADMST